MSEPNHANAQIVGSREIAAGTLKYTKLVRTVAAQNWTHYVWHGSKLVRNDDGLRCPAWHPDSERQCDFAVHEGDTHEFQNPVEWTQCYACHGGVEYHPNCGGEVIVHEPGCPRLEASDNEF